MSPGTVPHGEERRGAPRVRADQAVALRPVEEGPGGRAAAAARLVDCSETGVAVRVAVDGFGGPGAEVGRRLQIDVLERGALAGSRTVTVVRIVERDDDVLLGARFEGDEAVLDLDEARIDFRVALSIPADLATRRQVLPFAERDGVVHVAAADPEDASAIGAIRRFTGKAVDAQQAEPRSLARTIERVYRLASGMDRGGEDPEEPVSLGAEVLSTAILSGASDIHLVPEEEGAKLLLRIDGVLETLRQLTREQAQTLVSRLKVLASLDIAERRAAQDGKFQHSVGGGRSVDVRMATLPTTYGERVTLRLLSLDQNALTLETLGMSSAQLEQFDRAIHQPHGVLLLTGPTGSGKSTTLYAAVRRLTSTQTLNAITIEDPVEYSIPGASQVQVDHAQKVTFAKGLRSALRHDPDVIMVGEIRDSETADVAMKAALTGHLVLSTLHTNSAVGAITRLLDIDVPRYLTAAVLRAAVAQRLLRKLCPRCRRPVTLHEPQAALLERPDLAGATVYEPGGCLYCAGHGYVGRIAAFEILSLDDGLAAMVSRGAEEDDLRSALAERKHASLVDDAVAKLMDGRTSFEQVARHVLGR